MDNLTREEEQTHKLFLERCRRIPSREASRKRKGKGKQEALADWRSGKT